MDEQTSCACIFTCTFIHAAKYVQLPRACGICDLKLNLFKLRYKKWRIYSALSWISKSIAFAILYILHVTRIYEIGTIIRSSISADTARKIEIINEITLWRIATKSWENERTREWDRDVRFDVILTMLQDLWKRTKGIRTFSPAKLTITGGKIGQFLHFSQKCGCVNIQTHAYKNILFTERSITHD